MMNLVAILLNTCFAIALSGDSCACAPNTQNSDKYGSFCASWDAPDEQAWCIVASAASCGKEHTFRAERGHYWSHVPCANAPPGGTARAIALHRAKRKERTLTPTLTPTPKMPCCSHDHKRCTWLTKSAGFHIPRCEKQNLVAMLRFIRDVMQGSGVIWWITDGTLLGSLRGGSHISHETDIDVNFDNSTWPEADRLLKAAVGKTHYTFTSTSSYLHPARLFFGRVNRIHVDIWMASRSQDGTAVSELRPIAKQRRIVFQSELVPASMIFPLNMSCVYEGDTFPCPRESEKWLALRFGKDWRTPKRKYGAGATFHDGLGSQYDKLPPRSEWLPVAINHVAPPELG